MEKNNGFCSNGAHPSELALRSRPPGQELWGSYCAQGNQNVGSVASRAFIAGRNLHLYLAGYPSAPGIQLLLENLSDHSKLTISPYEDPGERWRIYDFRLPYSWNGKKVRVTASDESVAGQGWVAFSGYVTHPQRLIERQSMSVLAKLLLSLALMMLPPLALCCLAIRKHYGQQTVLNLICLAGVGLYGYVFFWIYFASPALGILLSAVLPAAAAVYCWFSFRVLDAANKKLLTNVVKLIGLTTATTLFVLAAGFLYGGFETPNDTAKVRFSHRLPPDNEIPYLFANQMARGHIEKPMVGDWLSSDRPPLQAGIYLSQIPFERDELGYLVCSVLCQCLWVMALWTLLDALKVSKRAIRLSYLVCFANGFVILNNFYTWPKFLSAAFFLGFAATLLSSEARTLLKKNRVLAILSGALLSLSLLAHGGSFFVLVGFALTLCILRIALPVRALILAFSVALVLYLPWMAYQKWYDPPGDRLFKWHLAGVIAVDERPFGTLLKQAYGNLTLGQWLKGRSENIRQLLGPQTEYWRAALLEMFPFHRSPGEEIEIATRIRSVSFFYLLPSIGFLLLGVPCFLIGWFKSGPKENWNASGKLILTGALSCVGWVSLMIVPASTLQHQGAYGIPILLLSGLMIALWNAAPLLAGIVLFLNAYLNVLVFGRFAGATTPRSGFLEQYDLRYSFAVLGTLALAGVIVLLRTMAKSDLQPNKELENEHAPLPPIAPAELSGLEGRGAAAS